MEKIKKIIRQELNAIGCQELTLPILTPVIQCLQKPPHALISVLSALYSFIIIFPRPSAIIFFDIICFIICQGHLWKKTGRWDQGGEELMRWQDRRSTDFVLSPTHEEAITALVGATVYT